MASVRVAPPTPAIRYLPDDARDYDEQALSAQEARERLKHADLVEQEALRLYAAEVAYMHVPLRCYWCRVRFCEKDNQGAWKCRYHPGYRSDTLDGARWTCCGRQDATADPEEKGCERCDHQPFPEKNPLWERYTDEEKAMHWGAHNSEATLPLALARYLHVPEKAILSEYIHPSKPLESYIKISRRQVEEAPPRARAPPPKKRKLGGRPDPS